MNLSRRLVRLTFYKKEGQRKVKRTSLIKELLFDYGNVLLA